MEQNKLKLIRELGQTYGKSARKYFEYANTPREYLPGYPIYMREADFLRALGDAFREDGLTMGELAAHLGVTQGAATQIASRLLKKEFITKHQSREDHRCIRVLLTPLGEKVCNAHRDFEEKLYQESLYNILAGLTEEQIKLLIFYEENVGRVFDVKDGQAD